MDIGIEDHLCWPAKGEPLPGQENYSQEDPAVDGKVPQELESF